MLWFWFGSISYGADEAGELLLDKRDGGISEELGRECLWLGLKGLYIVAWRCGENSYKIVTNNIFLLFSEFDVDIFDKLAYCGIKWFYLY